MPQINFADMVEEEEQKNDPTFADFASRVPPRFTVNTGVPQSEPLVPLTETVQEILGAGFDAETFAPPGLRISLSRGDNLEEKKLRLQKKYPEGDVKVLPESIGLGLDEDVLVWRESPQSQYKLLEPPGMDFTDIAEAISPSGESLAGEILMALLTRGATVPGVIARQGVAAAAGETIEQGVQQLTGVQDQGFSEAAEEVGAEFAFSLFGGAIGSIPTAVTNVATGRGALRVGEEGIETLQAADRLGSRALVTPGMITDNPMIMAQERQARGILPGIGRRYRRIVSSLNTAVKGAVPARINSAMSDVLTGLRDLSDSTIRNLGVVTRKATEGGKALQKGVMEYDLVAYRIVGDLYDAARRVEEPVFDFKHLNTVANDLRLGAKGKIDPEVDDLIKQFEAIDGPIELSNGILTVTEQLRNVRTGAYAAKNVPPGQIAGQPHGQANDLFKAIDETLRNPSNSSPEFVQAWGKGNAAAAERFSTLDKAAIIEIARSETPEMLVKKYAAPNNVSNLLVIRNTVEPAMWKRFQDSFYSDLLTNPSNLTKRLDDFDLETLDVLIPRSEQSLWRNIGGEMDRINAVGADRRMLLQVTNENFIADLLETANPNTTLVLRKAIANTRNRGLRDNVRAGVIDWAWDGVLVTKKNRLEVNRGRLKERIKALEKSGMLGLLTPAQRQVLNDVDAVAKAFEATADAGSSIRSMEIASGVPKLKPGALIGLAQSGMISLFYLSAPGRKILLGSGKESSQGEFIRIFSAAMLRAAETEDISELLEEQQ